MRVNALVTVKRMPAVALCAVGKRQGKVRGARQARKRARQLEGNKPGVHGLTVKLRRNPKHDT